MIKFCTPVNLKYFNWASTGLIPLKTKNEMLSLINYLSRKGNPDKEFIESIVEDCRRNAGELLNAKPESIALTHNTSEGLFIAMLNIISDKDKIICDKNAFPSTHYILNYNFPNNEKIFIDIDYDDPLSSIKKHIRKNVKVVVVDLVNYANGNYIELKDAGRYLKEKGIYLVVDGIQGIGCFQFNPYEYNVDFLSVGGTKWLLGIFGSGFLYVNPDILPKIKKVYTGWLAAPWKNFTDFSILPEPYEDGRRFETGTKNIISLKGLSENLKIFNYVGLQKIEKKIQILKIAFINFISEYGFTLYTIKSSRSGIVSIKHNLLNSEEIYNFLNKKKVIISLRNDLLRFSFHYFNNLDDVNYVTRRLKFFLTKKGFL